MKKIYLFLVLLILIGCESIPKTLTSSASFLPTSCPPILFAAEHKIYLGSITNPINLDNIAYQANINNAEFIEGCRKKNNIFSSTLSLLFIVSPLQEKQDIINFPFYVAILKENQEIHDIQFYSMNSFFNKNLETGQWIETELIETVEVLFPEIENNLSIVVGFMLDKTRLDFLY